MSSLRRKRTGPRGMRGPVLLPEVVPLTTAWAAATPDHAKRVTTAHPRSPEDRSRQPQLLGGHHERTYRYTAARSARRSVLARRRAQAHQLLVGAARRRDRV